SDLEGLVPGFGDWSGASYTGLWHFINMNPGLSNTYDTHQGMLYEEAGPHRIPGAVDLAIMVGGDIAGLTVNYNKSQGPHKYQVGTGSDNFPDGDNYVATSFRGKAGWEKYS